MPSFILKVPFSRERKYNLFAVQIPKFTDWILEKMIILMAPDVCWSYRKVVLYRAGFGAKMQAGVLHCARREKLKGPKWDTSIY